MSQSVTFECGLPPKGLRRNSLVKNHHAYKRAADEYAEAVWIAAHETQSSHTHCNHTFNMSRLDKPMDGAVGSPWASASVHYDWLSTHQMDEDNIIASMKVALDTCTTKGRRPLGIIEDDKGVAVSAKWQKAATKKAERVVITITEGEA